MTLDKASLALYAVTDRSWLNGRSLADDVESALQGGVTFVQIREKHLDEARFLTEAAELHQLCVRHGVPFVINDCVSIARTLGCGVHVGQSDEPVSVVRTELGPEAIIGVSVQTPEQALVAQQGGADYLGVGAVFPTSTKGDAKVMNIETLREICAAVDIPVVAIGGINRNNIACLGGTGIAGVAVVSAIFAQADIQAAARELRNTIEDVLADRR